MSHTDDKPHATIAAATEDMLARDIYVDIHAHAAYAGHDASGNDLWTYDGVKVYDNNQHITPDIRQSFNERRQLRLSLEADRNGNVPVGCLVTKGEDPRWYIVGEDDSLMFIDTPFVSVGTGVEEHLRFLHPTKQCMVRATFNSTYRPVPHSPPANASYLNDDNDGAEALPLLDEYMANLRLGYTQSLASQSAALDEDSEDSTSQPGEPDQSDMSNIQNTQTDSHWVNVWAKKGRGTCFLLPGTTQECYVPWADWKMTYVRRQRAFYYQWEKSSYWTRLPAKWITSAGTAKRSPIRTFLTTEDGEKMEIPGTIEWTLSEDGSFRYSEVSGKMHLRAPPTSS